MQKKVRTHILTVKTTCNSTLTKKSRYYALLYLIFSSLQCTCVIVVLYMIVYIIYV